MAATIQLAGCIIQNDLGHTLLLHRNTEQFTHWEIPGGKIEPDEAAHVAAKRELQEELGVNVEIVQQLGLRLLAEPAKDRILEYMWFLATIKGGQPQIMEPDYHDDVRYFAPHELTDLALSLVAQGFFEEVNAGRIKLII